MNISKSSKMINKNRLDKKKDRSNRKLISKIDNVIQMQKHSQKDHRTQPSQDVPNLNNIDLLYSKYGSNSSTYPTSFQLIKLDNPKPMQHITIEDLKTLNFSVLSYTIRQLAGLATKILRTSTFCCQNIQQEMLDQLVFTIANNYNVVAYHNFSHAFSLMLLNYQCLQKSVTLKQLYTEEEHFYILLAGLSHDLNHNGTNNNFQIKLNTDLAKISQGESVLQKMHIRHLWQILQHNPSINFLEKSTNSKQAKRVITRLILNTDVSLHFKNLQKLQRLRKTGQLDLSHNSEHKWLMMEQIFHACDIGNPCMSYDNYISWAALLSHEFNQQARLEEKMGIQITKPFVYSNLSSLFKDQIWFVDKLVYPLWKQLQIHWPVLETEVINIQKNLERVRKQMDKFQS